MSASGLSRAHEHRGPPRTASALPLIPAIVLAVLTLGLACFLLAAFVAPWNAVARSAPVSWAANARALDLLATGAASAAVLDRAERETNAALRLSPLDTGAWTRLVYIDLARGGVLGPDGLQALERTYQIAPLGPAITRWRILFVLENWDALPPALRQSAEYEIRNAWRRDRGFFTELRQSVTDREGRLVLARLVARLRLQDALDRREQSFAR